MSRADDRKREKRELDQGNEDLFMRMLKEAAPPNAPIGKPKGFKKSYPVMFDTILNAAIKFHEEKSK